MRGSSTANWAIFQKPPSTTKQLSSRFRFTSCNNDVILRKLSVDYRVGFKMIQNSKLVLKAGYRLQVTRNILRENLSNVSSNNVWRMFDWFYANIFDAFSLFPSNISSNIHPTLSNNTLWTVWLVFWGLYRL